MLLETGVLTRHRPAFALISARLVVVAPGGMVAPEETGYGLGDVLLGGLSSFGDGPGWMRKTVPPSSRSAPHVARRPGIRPGSACSLRGRAGDNCASCWGGALYSLAYLRVVRGLAGHQVQLVSFLTG
ncbi:MAG: hypothetical protein AB1445_10040 [Bacillota bacterium]